MTYNSQYFREQLDRYIEASPQLEFRNLNDNQHEVDLARRTVKKHQIKQYKFEAIWPFDITKRIEFTSSLIMLQLTIKNTSINSIFIESVTFSN